MRRVRFALLISGLFMATPIQAATTLTFVDGPESLASGQVVSPDSQASSATADQLAVRAAPIQHNANGELAPSQADLKVVNVGGISTVPEPGTWGLMLIGFGALSVSLRSRRRRTLPVFAQAV